MTVPRPVRRPALRRPTVGTGRRTGVRRLGTEAVVLVMLWAVPTACGDDTPAVCQDLEQLRSSVADLGDVQPEAGALATLQQDLKTISTQASKLVDDAGQALSGEATAVRDSVSGLGDAISAATASPSASTFGAVSTAVQAVATAVGDFVDAAAGTC